MCQVFASCLRAHISSAPSPPRAILSPKRQPPPQCFYDISDCASMLSGLCGAAASVLWGDFNKNKNENCDRMPPGANK